MKKKILYSAMVFVFLIPIIFYLIPPIFTPKSSEFVLFPNDLKYRPNGYNDSSDSSGNSYYTLLSDSGQIIRFKYTLRMHPDTKKDPYIGFYLPLMNKDSFVDISNYDSIRIKITTDDVNKTKSFKIQLKTFIPNFTRFEKYETFYINDCEIPIRPDSTQYSRSLKNDFKLVPCMFKSPIIASLPPVPNYSKLFSLDIQTGSCAINADSTSGYFSIKKIEFVKKPRVQSIIWIKIGYLFISLLIILLFFRSHSFNGEKTKSLSKIIKVSNQKPTATSNSDSLIFRNLCEKSFEIQKENTPDTQNIPIPSIRSKSEEGLERVEKYFHENYGNSGLTAELIAKSVEIPQERVTTLLKQKYKMTIPQYLNFIRIEAAKKLLIKSAESSIKEIAAKVGYSQVSHFNHKFNEIVGTSPQEFRKNYEV